MMLCEWKDFSTDEETYTQELFEEMIGDEFEAMMYKEHTDIPSYIWTVNFVVIVKSRTKFINEVGFEKIPRNPVCD